MDSGDADVYVALCGQDVRLRVPAHVLALSQVLQDLVRVSKGDDEGARVEVVPFDMEEHLFLECTRAADCFHRKWYYDTSECKERDVCHHELLMGVTKLGMSDGVVEFVMRQAFCSLPLGMITGMPSGADPNRPCPLYLPMIQYLKSEPTGIGCNYEGGGPVFHGTARWISTLTRKELARMNPDNFPEPCKFIYESYISDMMEKKWERHCLNVNRLPGMSHMKNNVEFTAIAFARFSRDGACCVPAVSRKFIAKMVTRAAGKGVDPGSVRLREISLQFVSSACPFQIGVCLKIGDEEGGSYTIAAREISDNRRVLWSGGEEDDFKFKCIAQKLQKLYSSVDDVLTSIPSSSDSNGDLVIPQNHPIYRAYGSFSPSREFSQCTTTWRDFMIPRTPRFREFHQWRLNSMGMVIPAVQRVQFLNELRETLDCTTDFPSPDAIGIEIHAPHESPWPEVSLYPVMLVIRVSVASDDNHACCPDPCNLAGMYTQN